MMKTAISAFILASSLQNLKASRFQIARKKLDQVLPKHQDKFDFILAYDALLMIMEDRHVEARDRFKECMRKLPTGMNSDEQYISLFCQFHLASYQGNGDLEDIRNAALKLDARTTVKRFLRFPSKGSLCEFRERVRGTPRN